ncbi:hypothetical protein PV328_008423 [Microctonus aethiopoides]|uniref:Uncharacterized protein n=1 Tax=Microctonus aethiopoides TaxID=144406 RepID=A0AA39FJH3_9HYME|nr:hypothetical protein PV328_008423 [Microctonus aethiopoides]
MADLGNFARGENIADSIINDNMSCHQMSYVHLTDPNSTSLVNDRQLSKNEVNDVSHFFLFTSPLHN